MLQVALLSVGVLTLEYAPDPGGQSAGELTVADLASSSVVSLH